MVWGALANSMEHSTKHTHLNIPVCMCAGLPEVQIKYVLVGLFVCITCVGAGLDV